MKGAKILIVDDEELIRWSLSEELAAAGYRTLSAENVDEGLALVEKETPDLILTDLRLGRRTGLDLLKEVRRGHPATPVILMTAFADLSSAVSALREGAADYISKPLQLGGLKITLERVLETAQLRTRLAETHRKRRDKYNFDSIVCASPSMAEALAMARKIAASPQGNVLILGESGCGKDRLARAIHYESARAHQPLLEVNATAIPEHLLESELFGYEKGAFTGAQARKKGIFESADGGTVFLNEIGHMPAGLQAKVLRVLEDKTFMRVGGTEDVVVDVRVLAATNEDLEKAVAEGRFRTDLYYRINVLTIRLAPLRERREDILPLAELILGRLCRELGRPRPPLSEETLAAFREHDWPGNVRELRNTLERMLILGESGFQPRRAPAGPAAAPAAPDGSLNLEEMEKAMVKEALTRTNGSHQKAAQVLGIGRDALRRRLEKFGGAGWFGPVKKAEAGEGDAFFAAHKEKAAELMKAEGAHKPVLEGRCAACHADPKDAKKLAAEYKPLCLSCHPAREASLKKPFLHQPFADGDCSTCHDPHGSKEGRLLNQPAKDLCAGCHTASDEALKKAHFGITELSGSCAACHDPHGGDKPKLIAGGKPHVPFGSRSCDMCHAPTGADGKAALKDTPEGTCFACHSDFRKKGAEAVVHPPFAAGDCVSCHDPHTRRRDALMKDSFDAVCFVCHEAGLKDNHPIAGHSTTKEGKADPRRKDKTFNCASCHDPHAGAETKLLTFKPGACEACHEK
ncbi:MAG: two component, sigma54 specific, Fis family transcriptional regulator [Elusimicrobia bacterium]|nr:MAG: two component, sigma54 specific, Fis family transcriptional regulator [Elusimicrobiota bacterium]